MTTNRPDFTTSTFWTNTGERIVRTVAQVELGMFTVDHLLGSNVTWDLAWKTGAAAAVYTLLTALAGKVVGDGGSPSFLLGAAPRLSETRRAASRRVDDRGGPDGTW